MNFKKLIKSQWSYMYAGILFGIAQIIYMIGLWINSVNHGKTPSLKPITVTTDLGKMFRGMEVFINNIFGFKTELYGKYATIVVDGVEKTLPATGGAFVPGVGWPIVGMIIGGYLVSRMERESRSWAYFSKKALIVSFVGGAFFSYGTRLGGGCTLNHLMGGVPMMNIHSLVTVIFMAIGGALGFLIMSKLGLANYFKHQETLAYVKNADKGEQATYKEGHKWSKKTIYWIALIFSLVFVFVAIYNGFFNGDSMEHIKGDAIKPFNKSVDHKGWFYVILTLVAGILGGIGLAKSGFGTECSLVAMETGSDMAKNDKKYAFMGVPRITRTLMRSYAPIIGIATHWVVMLAFILIAWIFLGAEPAFAGKVKYSLTAGSFIGGLLLGIGAVTLIGCEIRSYMRLGMGYVNTMVGFIGFAVGYLPFTLFYKGHKAFLNGTVIAGGDAKKGIEGSLTTKYKIYELFSDSEGVQQFILVLWWVFLLALTIYFIRKGMKNTGLQKVHMLHFNTEEVQEYIDEEAAKNNGMVNGVAAPMPVPPEAYPED
jgi:hypothetical protein